MISLGLRYGWRLPGLTRPGIAAIAVGALVSIALGPSVASAFTAKYSYQGQDSFGVQLSPWVTFSANYDSISQARIDDIGRGISAWNLGNIPGTQLVLVLENRNTNVDVTGDGYNTIGFRPLASGTKSTTNEVWDMAVSPPKLKESDILLSAAVTFVTDPAVVDTVTDELNSYTNYRLAEVVAHEVGHAIGLTHEAFRMSVMCANYSAALWNSQRLHGDDRNAARTLYPSTTFPSPTETDIQVLGWKRGASIDSILVPVWPPDASPALADTVFPVGAYLWVEYTLENLGTTQVMTASQEVFLSQDLILDGGPGDYLVGAAIGDFFGADRAAGGNANIPDRWESIACQIPCVPPGTYYMGLILDRQGGVQGDSVRSNNHMWFGKYNRPRQFVITAGSASPPNPPLNCSATDNLCGIVRVSWSPPYGGAAPIRYRIYRDSGNAPIDSVAAPDSTYEDHPPDWWTHSYWVRAVNTCGASGPSNTDNGIALPEAPVPGNLRATDYLCKQIQVSWDWALSDPDSFRIWGSAPLASVPGTVRSWTDTRVPRIYNTDYYPRYYVAAYTAGQCPAPGAGPAYGHAWNDTTPVPGYLTNPWNDCGGVTIRWQFSDWPHQTTVQGFRVYRNDTLAFQGMDKLQREWNDAEVVDTSYVYKVESYSQCAHSLSQGLMVSVKTAIPPVLEAKSGSCAGIPLSWTWGSSGEDSFQVFRDGVHIHSVPAGVRTWTDQTASYGAHAYIVRPVLVGSCTGKASTSVTASRQLPIQYLVTSNVPGAYIVENGVLYGVPPSGRAFACSTCTVSATRTLSVEATQSVSGTRYCFGSWSDGGRRSHTVVLGSDSTIALNLIPGGSGPTTVPANATLYDDAYDCKSPYLFAANANLSTTSPGDTFHVWGKVKFRFPRSNGSEPRDTLFVFRPLVATGAAFETTDSTSAAGHDNLWGGIMLYPNASIFLDSCVIRNADWGIQNRDACPGISSLSVQHSVFEWGRNYGINAWFDPVRSPTAWVLDNEFHLPKAVSLSMASTSLVQVGSVSVGDNFFYDSPTDGAGAVAVTGPWGGQVSWNTFTVGQPGALGLVLVQGQGSCLWPPEYYGSPSVHVNYNRFSIVKGNGRYALRTAFGPITTIDAAMNDWNYYIRSDIEEVIDDGSGRAEAIFEPFWIPSGGGGGGGGGTCPYVLVPRDNKFVPVNTILGESERRSSSRSLVTDTYPLEEARRDVSGRVRIRIAEWEHETTRLDQVGLVVLPRVEGAEVATTPDGRIVSYWVDGEPIEAVGSASGTPGAGPPRGRLTAPYSGAKGDSLELRVRVVHQPGRRGRGGDAIVVPYRHKDPGGRSTIDDPGGVVIRFSPDEEGGQWISAGPLLPREEWSTVVLPLGEYGASHPKRVRVVWRSSHEVGPIHVAQVERVEPVAQLVCTEARHSNGQSVQDELAGDDGSVALLRPGEHIDLEFDAQEAPKDALYVLQARGRYDSGSLAFAEGSPPTEFALKQIGPNPFNPETFFELRLPHGAHVTMRIFDAQGRLVRVLEDREVSAGTHRLGWDGTNRGGAQLASGVYFLDLKAGEFSSKRRLVLLR